MRACLRERVFLSEGMSERGMYVGWCVPVRVCLGEECVLGRGVS